MIKADVRVTYDVTGKLKKGFEEAAQVAITKIVFDGEATAKQAVTDYNAIDTGALKNSIYSVVPGASTYSDAQSAAKSANAEAEVLPAVTVPSGGRAIGALAVGVAYAVYVNFGTAFMPARAFWTRAVESIEQQFKLVVGPMTSRAMKVGRRGYTETK